ncbi:c-type cytochrome [Methylocucumis oryzae]|uniref:Cytochrome C n=1 Tax=Methylocucumis oryzae TaxID=1632867 RepID=A0A0F3IEM7_9GAMM|nr:c-type cytochrome [Methylocucumis oryzae]KJV05265.1 cytochrome C [Methylocucumis oryzae]
MKTKWLAFILLASTAGSGPVMAEGNGSAGAEKSATCVSCHGEHGNSMVATFPKLAQQHATYLEKQLLAFKNGTRKDPMMATIAKGLSEKDILDIAAYYEEQKISANALPKPEPDDDEDDDIPAQTEADIQKMLSQGADLYRNGDIAREVSACIACHGPTAEGNKPAGFPSLKSQHADYLIKTLTDFKNGNRSNNPDNMMVMIAKKMTLDEIKAVAYRISVMK